MARQTAAQKLVTDKFKMAVAYRKAHPDLTQKQAFAKVFGKRVLNEPAKKKKTLASKMNIKSRVKATPKKQQTDAYWRKLWLKQEAERKKQYKQTMGKTKAAPKKKTVSRSAPVKKAVAAVSKYTVASRVANPSTNVSAIQKQLVRVLTSKLGNLESDKFMARTKTEKNKIAKEIAKTKVQLNHLKKYI